MNDTTDEVIERIDLKITRLHRMQRQLEEAGLYESRLREWVRSDLKHLYAKKKVHELLARQQVRLKP